jgi:hypothetical protein
MDYWYLLFGSAYLGGCLAAPTGFASPVASARWQCSAAVKGAGSKEPTTAKCRATTSGGGWWHGCLATLWLALADGIWWGRSRTATLRAGAERLHDEHQLSTGRRIADILFVGGSCERRDCQGWVRQWCRDKDPAGSEAGDRRLYRPVASCDRHVRGRGLSNEIRNIESVSRMVYSVMLNTVAEVESRNVVTTGFATANNSLGSAPP